MKPQDGAMWESLLADSISMIGSLFSLTGSSWFLVSRAAENRKSCAPNTAAIPIASS
ncbi:Uncharacterised protein [Burkholderia pseudomallei]|nr:Uncharacterised protein [Burkholderia pseudomallei]